MTNTKHIYSKPDFALEVLMSFIFYLMKYYAWQPDKNTGVAISKYLHKLAEHPACNSALLAKVVKRLSCHWQLIHETHYGTGLFIHDRKIHT